MTDSIYNFSGRDYTAAFERLLSILRIDVPELSDLNHSDAGVSLIRLLARESDQLAFYLDEAFAEGYINTARYKQSLIDLAKLTGYPPKLAAAATATVTITRTEGNDLINIPKYSAFTRTDGKSYLAISDYALPVGTNTLDIEVRQGTRMSLALTAEDFAANDMSGLLKHNLGKSVAAGTVVVSSGVPPVPWTEVDGFWRTTATDQHFFLELYADKYAEEIDTVFLVLGPIGAPADRIVVDYIVTDESAGNCGYSKIIIPPSGLESYISCTNADPATGGAACEDIESLRTRIPRVTRTQRRGVILEDYDALIESIAGVKWCQTVDRTMDHDWPHLYLAIYVVPEGGGPMSALLRENIIEELMSWGHLGNWSRRYILKDAVEVPVNVLCKIGITPGNVPQVVVGAVVTAIQNIISEQNLCIAETLKYSDLHIAIEAVPGVSWANLTTPSDNVDAANGTILVPGTITVTY